MVSDAAAAAARTLADLVPRLARLIASALEADPEIALSLRQYRLLERLADRSYRTTELASTSGISQPTASAALTSLQARGLVRREPDPTDRRATLVVLTGEGRAKLETARRCVLELLVLVTGDMTPGQAAALERLQPVIARGMDRAREAVFQARRDRKQE